MPKSDFENNPDYWVLATANVLERVANEELATYGITYRQVQVLGCLACFGEISQVALAERIHVEPSTIVRILDRMERDGWVVRVPSPTDRRVKIIQATDNVKPVWKTITECGQRIRERMTRGLSTRQVKQLNELLETVWNNLGGEP